MNSKHILAFFLLTAAFLYCADSHAQDKNVVRTGSEITHGLIGEAVLHNQIAFLSDSLCAGRGTGSRGSVEAAYWIMRNFKKLGIKPFGENYGKSFYASEDSCLVGHNVIGLLPSSGSRQGKGYIVLAAHYDGLGQLDGKMYPGADSNASGVVAMLNVCKMIQAMMTYGKTYRQNIIVAAVDGKNTNMRGVKALWDMIERGELTDPLQGKHIGKEDISMMVNIDQIGSSLSPLGSGDPDYLIMLTDEDAVFLRSSLSFVSSRYAIPMDLGYDYYGSRTFTEAFFRSVSEQRVFLENGVQSVMFTSGISMNNNKTWDRVDTLNMGVLKKRIWMIFHWLERVI